MSGSPFANLYVAVLHLRSVKTIESYEILARGENFGHVEDFVFDDENWTIRYIVVNTAKFWNKKSVIISPNWVKSISWSDQKVSVDLTGDQIKNSPVYDPNTSDPLEYSSELADSVNRK